eukprot:sb/3471078/
MRRFVLGLILVFCFFVILSYHNRKQKLQTPKPAIQVRNVPSTAFPVFSDYKWTAPSSNIPMPPSLDHIARKSSVPPPMTSNPAPQSTSRITSSSLSGQQQEKSLPSLPTSLVAVQQQQPSTASTVRGVESTPPSTSEWDLLQNPDYFSAVKEELKKRNEVFKQRCEELRDRGVQLKEAPIQFRNFKKLQLG